MSREKGRSCSRGFGGTQWGHLIYHAFRGRAEEEVLHLGVEQGKELCCGGKKKGRPERRSHHLRTTSQGLHQQLATGEDGSGS